MDEYRFAQADFEHPSVLFVLEDSLKSLVGEPFMYNPYVKTFGLKGDERVLDFGCGGGVGSRCLANYLNKGGHLTCVDISGYWMKKARKRLNKYSNVECRSGDIRELGIPDSSFDVISTMHVIHDIAPADRQDVAKALSRSLRAGGSFFIREPIKESHGMPPEEIRSLLAAAGLRETSSRQTKSEYMGKYQKTG